MSKKRLRIDVARVYHAPFSDKSFRVLVDRLWPRGVKKEALKLDAWMKELAPSSELRRWFNHDPQRWSEFQKRYANELQSKPKELERLRAVAERQPLLLLYSARDEDHNNAIALKKLLEDHE